MKGSGSRLSLVRININEMSVSRVEGLLDARLCDSGPAVLMAHRGRLRIDYNGLEIPLGLSGDGRIARVLDGRILFVEAGDDMEIVDAQAGKSIYRYSSQREYLLPDDYNLVIRAIDQTGPGADDSDIIFYKVLANGVESGRTDTGPSQVHREFKSRHESNQYLIIRLERWKLDKAKGRYERVNNVQQPKPFRIFLPENRVIGIDVTFDGKKYEVRQSALLKQ
jgi:hypothetical protein